ncbi:MAG: RiPP maturation radical SAM C-methyltransferase [Kofleriaceae bacterium]
MSRCDVGPRLRQADLLLIVPPFAWQDRPALGVHLIQAIAREVGLEAQVLYTNILFSAWFGEEVHAALARLQYGLFLGERLFARAAFDVPPLGLDAGAGLVSKLDAAEDLAQRTGIRIGFDLETIRGIEAQIPAWLDSFMPSVAGAGYRVVGATSSFEQTAASIAMLRAIKAADPKAVTIMGGANCEGEMAEGICSLGDAVDVVFSGESEQTFRDRIHDLVRGILPPERIVRGQPWTDMDALPTPDYYDYYDQMRAWVPGSKLLSDQLVYLAYETSRGCWWGEKSHCTFCGLNGQGMASREKSPERVLDELERLLAVHPTRKVAMTDNIMPRAYFRTLLPRLAERVPDATIMYEQKANLSLADVRDLVEAGVREIQPGIEALSTGLLKLMRKGTTAAQNIALLRFARATGLRLHWNLLVGFPNDEVSFYEETLELLPLLQHLQPPHPPCPVVFDRFSPYFDHPEQFGIRELRPFWFYRDVFPETADIERLAYHFEGTFHSASLEHPDILRRIGEVVHAWRQRFYSRPPELRVLSDRGAYLLVDSRGLPGLPAEQTLDRAQAAAALVTTPLRGPASAAQAWALQHRVAIERNQRCVALAIAEPALIAELELDQRRPSDALKLVS